MLSSEPNLAQPSWGPRAVLIGVAALAVVVAASLGALRALDFANGGVGKAPLWAALASTFILQAGLAGAAYRLGPRSLDKLRQLFGPVRLGTARLFLWGGATFVGTVGLTILYAVPISAISEDFLPPPSPRRWKAASCGWSCSSSSSSPPRWSKRRSSGGSSSADLSPDGVLIGRSLPALPSSPSLTSTLG